MVKNLLAMQEKSRRRGFDPWKEKIPPEESMSTHSNILFLFFRVPVALHFTRTFLFLIIVILMGMGFPGD